jgi:predicted porin
VCKHFYEPEPFVKPLEKIEMKKTLVAVAAMFAVTGAMADVTIFGIVDQAYVMSTDKTAGVSTKTTSVGGQYTGSELGFKGSEDLGNGLTANFQIHFAPSTETATSPSGYQSHVGLSGGFGAVKLGQYFSPLFFHNAAFDATGQSAIGYNVANAVTGTGGLTSNAIQYDLPTLVPGLGVSYMMAKGEVARPTTAAYNDTSNIRLMYSTGPFSAGISTATKKGAAGASTKESGTGASYDLGMAKVLYNATSSKAATATVATKGSNIGVSIPFGATTLNYTSTTAKNTSLANVQSSGSLLQAIYALSKRSSVIFQSGTSKITSGTSNGDTDKVTAVGLHHSF